MSSLKLVQLCYNQKTNSWLLRHQTKKNTRTIHWGASFSPFVMRATATSMKHPSSIPMSAKYTRKGSKIFLGPLIGILTSKGSRSPISGNIQNFKDLIRAGKKMGAILFVFTPECVHWEQKNMKGWIYDTNAKGWTEIQFPFPNVVYNRVPSRSQESSMSVQNCIQKLKRVKGLTLFNSNFFNKQDLFAILEASEEVKGFLPDTRKLKSSNVLSDMLHAYGEVYLKPEKGKSGDGILKVSFQPESRIYRLFSQKKATSRQKQVKSVGRVWDWYKQQKSPSPYLIQQAIDLHEINGCPFDFRALVQKNQSGVWEVTGIGTRVAGQNRITTHVPRGGRIESPNLVLKPFFTAAEIHHIKKNIRNLALTIAKAIEQTDPHIGEMSMDIGLDKKNRLWFFEANSKPMKFDEPKIRKKSLENLIFYSQFITFRKGKGVKMIRCSFTI